MQIEGETLFHEEQRFTQGWLWTLLIGVALLETATFGYGLYRQLVLGQSWGNHPTTNGSLITTFLTACGASWGILILFRYARLITVVNREGLRFRFIPFQIKYHTLPWSRIRSAQARQYSPIREYGGWGIRYGRKGKAYNVSGDRGVEVELADGKSILFGSQRADEFAAALKDGQSRYH